MAQQFETEVDESGRLALPPEFARKYGLNPGTRIRIEDNANGLNLRRPVTQLARIYIEPTSRCNLNCVTCIRNSWDEPLGDMSSAVFSRVIEGLKALSAPPSVLLGGLGEPLFHPEIVGMVAQAKSLNCSVELITNGTLLTAEISDRLIKAGLDRLWVSLDGATSESYCDIRLGALFPDVLNNLKAFHNARLYNPSNSSSPSFHGKPELGIVFVAMKRNIQDLPAILSLAKRLGAGNVLVSKLTSSCETKAMKAQAT